MFNKKKKKRHLPYLVPGLVADDHEQRALPGRDAALDEGADLFVSFGGADEEGKERLSREAFVWRESEREESRRRRHRSLLSSSSRRRVRLVISSSQLFRSVLEEIAKIALQGASFDASPPNTYPRVDFLPHWKREMRAAAALPFFVARPDRTLVLTSPITLARSLSRLLDGREDGFSL